MKPLSEVVPLLLVIQIQTQAVWKVGRSDATPINFFSIYGNLLGKFW